MCCFFACVFCGWRLGVLLCFFFGNDLWKWTVRGSGGRYDDWGTTVREVKISQDSRTSRAAATVEMLIACVVARVSLPDLDRVTVCHPPTVTFGLTEMAQDGSGDRVQASAIVHDADELRVWVVVPRLSTQAIPKKSPSLEEYYETPTSIRAA